MIRPISRGYRVMATAVTAVSINLMLAPAAHDLDGDRDSFFEPDSGA